MTENTLEQSVYAFSPCGRELIIKTPRLRRPWFNYISGSGYGLKFSQTAGGFSVFPLLEGVRIIRYEHGEGPGRCVYLKDRESGEFWSLNWQPVRKDLDEYECRHGQGYSVIHSGYGGINHSLRVFAAENFPGEIWEITITNNSGRTRDLSFFPFVEWYLGSGISLWDAPGWYTRTEFDPEKQLIAAEFFDPKDIGQSHSAFMKPFFDVDGYCCSKRMFCGFAGGLESPAMIQADDFKNPLATGEETIASFRRDLALGPGESREFSLLLGFNESGRSLDEGVRRFRGRESRKDEFNRIGDHWKAVANKHFISTPDASFNRWINVWLKYQEHQCFKWAGLGEPNAPLLGYRDTLQHVLAMNLFAPELAKERILEALRHQYENGRAVRQWSRRGNHDRRDYRDSPVWIVFALCGYLKETHDFSILEIDVPYLDSAKSDPVLMHAVKAVNCLFDDRGERGLSRIGEGDWYDPLNRAGIKGRGESVWLSMALVAALREISALFGYMGRPEEAGVFSGRADEVSRCVNEHGWDGEWYLRAFDDEGEKIGSAECEEGRIFTNPQTWAVISGAADPGRAQKCMESVEKHLKNIYGYSIETPHFSTKNIRYGNVGILQALCAAYAHVGAFKMLADCMLGRGEDAYRTFKLLEPLNPGRPPEETAADPHIIPNGYFHFGGDSDRAYVKESGSSGAFPWILKVVIEHMMGAGAEYEGLRVSPCLPDSWETASIRREFRGSVYNIRIINAAGEHEGGSLEVDGVPIDGSLIRPSGSGEEHSVVFRRGKRGLG